MDFASLVIFILNIIFYRVSTLFKKYCIPLRTYINRLKEKISIIIHFLFYLLTKLRISISKNARIGTFFVIVHQYFLIFCCCRKLQGCIFSNYVKFC